MTSMGLPMAVVNGVCIDAGLPVGDINGVCIDAGLPVGDVNQVAYGCCQWGVH